MNIAALRRLAVLRAFPSPAPLGRAIALAGFIQADPIRAPARAQDLILRHRVTNYRAGELERRYPRLGLEEAYLYAYGFMPSELRALLLPRHDPDGPHGRFIPAGLAAEVLAFVRDNGPTHPAALEAHFGADRQVNGWGGQSKATTRALELLLHYGFVRVARRDAGIRVYQVTPEPQAELAQELRLERLMLVVASALAPVAVPTLMAATARLRRAVLGPEARHDALAALTRAGALEAATVDGVRYLWPAGTDTPDFKRKSGESLFRAQPPHQPCARYTQNPAASGYTNGRIRGGVRFLAPFDPLVWDRRRFEHLWGWQYRFEAYTPPAKRRLGYYAMPLLWGSEVIGWVNCTEIGGRLDVKAGFATRKPGADFRRAFDAEVARMQAFLATKNQSEDP